jgi:hypothetical protein
MRAALLALGALSLSGCVLVSSREETGPRVAGFTSGLACDGEQMVETRLYLGMAMPTGSVSEQQLRAFIDSEVATRWKEGFTVLSGEGLWYSETRKITEREPSRVLIRLHDGSPGARADIEAIRAAYIKRFNQDAVLRTDAAACADF